VEGCGDPHDVIDVSDVSDVSRQDSEEAPPRAFGRYPLTFVVYLALCTLGVAAILPAGLREAAELPVETIVWIVFLAGSNLLTFQALPRLNMDVSVGAPVHAAVVVLFPPPLAALISFLGFTNEREFRRAAPLAMSLFNRCQVALAAYLAGWVVHGLFDLGPISSTVVAVLVYNAANTVFVGAVFWARGKMAMVDAARRTAMPFPRFALDFGLVAMLALYIVLAYTSATPFAATLLALPLWLGFSALKSSRRAEDRAEELADRVRELETLNVASTELLSSRSPVHASQIAGDALSRALDTDDIEVSLAEPSSRPDLVPLAVPGAGHVHLGVPGELSERQRSVVEAIAGLFGMTLVRQQLEQDLAEVQRARAALSGQILEEGTRERSRIALEIHDDVLPSLAAAQIQADNVRSALAAGAVERADEIARLAHEASNASIVRLREVLDDLHRQILVPGALRPHLLDALHELKLHHGIEVELHAPDELCGLPHAVEILLLETVRGCLANVARHAAATTVEVVVELTEQAVALSVRDDGRGFDPGHVEHGHHGLALMAQRVELTRGRFTVTSALGRGTQIDVEVPL
jgi:signal transduction histidine kinase